MGENTDQVKGRVKEAVGSEDKVDEVLDTAQDKVAAIVAKIKGAVHHETRVQKAAEDA